VGTGFAGWRRGRSSTLTGEGLAGWRRDPAASLLALVIHLAPSSASCPGVAGCLGVAA
jgi:hypothetical protein